MKLAILSLALLCAPVLAQETAPPLPTQLAQIDPVALNLLARMSWKYRNTSSYETYIHIKRSDVPAAARFTTRFRTDMGQFVWSRWSPDGNWSKWVFDGTTVVNFNSYFPKSYTRRKLGRAGILISSAPWKL